MASWQTFLRNIIYAISEEVMQILCVRTPPEGLEEAEEADLFHARREGVEMVIQNNNWRELRESFGNFKKIFFWPRLCSDLPPPKQPTSRQVNSVWLFFSPWAVQFQRLVRLHVPKEVSWSEILPTQKNSWNENI